MTGRRKSEAPGREPRKSCPEYSIGPSTRGRARSRRVTTPATLDTEDSWAIHAADTLDEGHFVNDPEKVETVTKQMPDRLRELDEWGMEFSRTTGGEIDRRFFGAQSFRRTAFAGDHTGESMLDALVDRPVRDRPREATDVVRVRPKRPS